METYDALFLQKRRLRGLLDRLELNVFDPSARM